MLSNRFFLLYVFMLIADFAKSQTVVNDTLVGMSYLEPNFSYAPNAKDFVNGVPYFYIKNDCVIVNIGTTSVLNAEQGSRHPGAVMDFVLRSNNRENIDWAIFQLNSSEVPTADNNTKTINVDSIRYSLLDTSINVYGKAKYNQNLRVTIKYKLINHTPILKIKISIQNVSNSPITGYLSYILDPDEGSQENSYVPGLGVNVGVVSSGWTDNYIYSGILGNGTSNYPNHALAWLENVPYKLMSTSYTIGLSYNYTIIPNGTVKYEFYQIAGLANKPFVNGSIGSITQWTSDLAIFDPDFTFRVGKFTGKIKNSSDVILSGVNVRLLNSQGQELASSRSNEFGEYRLFPFNLDTNKWYILTAEKLGFDKQSYKFYHNPSSIVKVYDFDNISGKALKPINIDLSFTKLILADGKIASKQGDIVFENNDIVVGVANPNKKKYTNLSVLDFYLKSSNFDLLDVVKLTRVSYLFDSLNKWWSDDNYIVDTLYINELTNNKAVLRVEGHMISDAKLGTSIFPVDDSSSTITRNSMEVVSIFIVNDIIVEVGKKYFTVNTNIQNRSRNQHIIYFGDILKTEGTNTRSYVPGIGELKKNFNANPQAHLVKSTQPWVASYSDNELSYGMIYDYNPDYFYYDNNWISSISKYVLKPREEIEVSRNIVIAKNSTNLLFKHKGIEAIYNQLAKEKSKLNLTIDINPKKNYNVGDSITISFLYTNQSNKDISSKLKIIPPFMVGTKAVDTTLVIKKNGFASFELKYKILQGGRSQIKAIFTDEFNVNRSLESQIFSKGEGWYSGDLHTHSTFAGGVNTIEQNALYAKSIGLSFMAASEHNTIAHYNEVGNLNNKYNDFIVLPGQEVTTTKGHFLAYNAKALIPWNLQLYTKRQMVDSAINQVTPLGKSFVYIAHPNMKNYEWLDTVFYGIQGIEVWNSFQLDFNFNNSATRKSFTQWDSLNNLGRHIFGVANSDAHGANAVGVNYIVAKLDSFTQSEIIGVLRDKGTFYGSNGPMINFTINSVQMGGTVFINSDGANATMRIEANSNSDDSISEIKLYRNGQLVKTWGNLGRNIILKEFIEINAGEFYRIELIAGNGYAFSNPIWIELKDISLNVSLDDYLPEFNSIKKKFKVIPNPADSRIEIIGMESGHVYKYTITTIRGDEVSKGQVSSKNNIVLLDELQSDIYILNVTSSDGVYEDNRVIFVVKKW